MSFSEEFIKKYKINTIRGAALIESIEKALDKNNSLYYHFSNQWCCDIESLVNLKKNLDDLGLHEVKAKEIYNNLHAPKNMYYFFETNASYIKADERWTYDYKIINDLSKVDHVSGIAITL